MKGATADPSVRTIIDPKSNKINIIGPSQNFFLYFIKPHKSLINSSINNSFPYVLFVILG